MEVRQRPEEFAVRSHLRRRNDDIVYACKGCHGIDGKTGEVKWADKDVVGEFYLVTDDLLVVEHKDKVRGHSPK